VYSPSGSESGDQIAMPSWYAVQTRSRHERIVANHLAMRGVAQYVPTITEVHRWSDRQKKVELPLFQGYVFVCVAPSNEKRVDVLRTPGVVRFVGATPEGTPIPNEQIESVRALLDRNITCLPHPFLKAGERVRVKGGALHGVEGVFVRRNAADTLIISIDAIQRSLCVSIKGYDLEVLGSSSHDIAAA
jgi:transcription termination/antitermination protein NusG